MAILTILNSYQYFVLEIAALEIFANGGFAGNSNVNYFTSSSSSSSSSLAGIPEICDNGVDDDGDGLIDCFDDDCCGQDVCHDFWYNGCLDSTCIKQGFQNFSMDFSAYAPQEIPEFSNVVTGDIDYDGDTDIAIANGKDQILILDGASGELVNIINLVDNYSNSGIIGIAEVTSMYPGAEILVCDYRATLYSSNGDFIWQTDQLEPLLSCSFADFNQDGIPEIYIDNLILNGLNGIEIIKIEDVYSGFSDFRSSVAIDIYPSDYCPDCDGLEFIINSKIYAVDIENMTYSLVVEFNNNSESDAVSIVVDWNNDGLTDIVSYGPLGIDVWSPVDLSTYHSYRGYLGGGIPSIGDIDGDGMVELTFINGSNGGTMICLNNDFSILWEKEVIERSGSTGMTLFDFDNDGSKEIVYRDHRYLRIIRGLDGEDLEMIKCGSGTGLEYPVVADIDQDLQANILDCL